MQLSDIARRLADVFDLGAWAAWFTSLDRSFVFLLVLPFVVAVIGLWASWRQRDDEEGK
jgi:hypothetical protein